MAFSSAVFGPNTGVSIAQRAAANSAGKKISQMGRGGDTMAIHASPFTQNLLKALGGSGGMNPKTGLTEFQPADGDYNSAYDNLYTQMSDSGAATDLAISAYERDGTVISGYENLINAYTAAFPDGAADGADSVNDGAADGTGAAAGADGAADSTSFINTYDEDSGTYSHGNLTGLNAEQYQAAVQYYNDNGSAAAGIADLGLTDATDAAGGAADGAADGADGAGGAGGGSADGATSGNNLAAYEGMSSEGAYGDATYGSYTVGGNDYGYDLNLQASKLAESSDSYSLDANGQLVYTDYNGNSYTLDPSKIDSDFSGNFLPDTENLNYFTSGSLAGGADSAAGGAADGAADGAGGNTGEDVFDADGTLVGTMLDGVFTPVSTAEGSADGTSGELAATVADGVLAETDPNDFAGQIASLKAEIKKLASPEEEAEIDETTDFEGLVKKLEELFEKYMSSGYSPAALLNMFGFTDGDTEKDFDFMIPTYSGSDNVYTRKAVKDRDTGEIRYINVPIGDMASGGGSFQANRRAGFGSMF